MHIHNSAIKLLTQTAWPCAYTFAYTHTHEHGRAYTFFIDVDRFTLDFCDLHIGMAQT